MVREVGIRIGTARRAGVAALVVSLLALAACGSGNDTSTPRPAARTTASVEPPAAPAPFDRANFDRSSITITNRYLPLTPGRRYVYDGSTLEDGKSVSHREEFTVTDLVKEVDGVETVVIADKDFGAEGELQESELTFFAQDRAGAVWHFGQYRESYDGKELVGGQAWLAGALEGARPGIFMLADPQVGTPSYSEGYAPPPFYWDDDARVARVHEQVTVPAGRYDDVVVIKEFNAEEPGAQLKYYAPGVGFVRVGWEGADTQHETLALTTTRQLTGDELTKARADALALDTRANMYGSTAHTQIRPPGT